MTLAQIADRNGRSETPQAPEQDAWYRVLYCPTWGYDCDETAYGKAYTEKQSQATRRTKTEAHNLAAQFRENGQPTIVIRLRPRREG